MVYITSLAASNYSGTDLVFYVRYTPEDTIKFIEWSRNGTFYGDWTESNSWNRLYYPRHHQNIVTDDKIYDVWYIWNGSYTDRI